MGPQRSKKQKKQAAQSGISKEKRVARNAALQGIREQFNPFEVKAPARPSKYEFANGPTKKFLARPGVTKSLGEETVSGYFSKACNIETNTYCEETQDTTVGDAPEAKSR